MTTPPNVQTDDRLRAGNEALYRSLFEATGGLCVALDPVDYRVVAVSDNYLKLLRRSRDDLLGKIFFDAFPGDPAKPEADGTANLKASFERVRATLQPDAMGIVKHAVLDYTTGKLEERYWKPLNSPLLDADGRLFLLIHATEDVTARVHADETLRRVRTLERIAGVTARVGGWILEFDEARTVTWGREIYQMYEWDDEEPPHVSLVQERMHPDSARLLARVSEACEKQGQPFDVEITLTSFKGMLKWFRVVGEPETDSSGRVVRMIGAVQDITRQKTEQRRIVESEERLKYVTESALDVVWDIDLSDNTCWCSNGVGKYGYDFGNKVIPAEDWLSKLHPDDRRANTPGLESTLADPTAKQWACSYRFRTASGNYVHFEDRCYILRDADGKPVRMVGGSTDVTKRLEMEEQLLQTQRLESLGQLTGGIAHDFNNLLTVILGNTELLEDELQRQHGLLKYTNNISMAAQRGSTLTRQLLAFSRKQALQPTSLDVNRLLINLRGMLTRTLGEHIVIELKQQDGLWPAYVDPNQLEIALLNLCINARDAMPRGGTVTMETCNVTLGDTFVDNYREVKPGDYVRIIIADTGTGIAPDVLDHVFEPFFTTKEKGKGTGLGLSMVFGFVKQSNGHINIYSEVGLGTTIRLYLPSSLEAGGETAQHISEPAVVGGNELILLVEDNDLVREFGTDLLRSLGYRVLAAPEGKSALGILQQRSDIDLLFTDVVMPGMGGHELASRALQLQPDLKVLFTSGYTQDSMRHNGQLDVGVHMLAKPYSKAELADKLRQVLRQPTA